jgi:hypothetical protein
MRKYIVAAFLMLIIVSGCTMGEQSQASEFAIEGKYVCSNDYISNGEHFERFPEDIPSITFYEDENCEVVINYLEGICFMQGTYTIENDQVFVTLSFEGTTFEGTGSDYIDSQYTFSILTNDRITIDKNLYIAREGDPFIKAGS